MERNLEKSCVHDYSQVYLTFVALEDGTFQLSENTVSYSLDEGKTWTNLEANKPSPIVKRGCKIMWKGYLIPHGYSGVGTFSSTRKFIVQGNVMSLLYGDDFKGQTSLAGKCYAFCNLFNDNKNVVNAEDLSLPATELADSCYESMFYGCTSLTTAPALNATEMAGRCYMTMFYGCTSLTTAPALPATKLAEDCYCGMLVETDLLPDCTNIDFANESVVQSGGLSGLFMGTNVMDSDLEKILPMDSNGKYCLPVMNLAESCYESMFEDCTSLTTAPALPATEMAGYCYMAMFYGCSSLTEAPALPATKLAKDCYCGMLGGTDLLPDCTNIDFASESVVQSGGLGGLFVETKVTDFDLEKILPKDGNGKYCLPVMNLAESCYENMFQDCTSLTTAPALPAAELASHCYQGMFEGCTSLNYIKAMFTTNPSTLYTEDWVEGVAESGTFVKNSAATWTTTDDDVVPSGWTIETASE